MYIQKNARKNDDDPRGGISHGRPKTRKGKGGEGGGGGRGGNSHGRTRQEKLLQVRPRKEIDHGDEAILGQKIQRTGTERTEPLPLGDVARNQSCLASEPPANEVVSNPRRALLEAPGTYSRDPRRCCCRFVSPHPPADRRGGGGGGSTSLEYVHLGKVAHLATFDASCVIPLGRIGALEEDGTAILVASDCAADAAIPYPADAPVVLDAPVAHA